MLFPAADAATPGVANATGSELDRQRAMIHRTHFKVLGGEWILETEPTIAFLRQSSGWGPLLILLMGSALTLVLASYIAALRTQNQKVQRLVAVRTAELERVHLDLRSTEMIAMQSEKMSSLGQMVAGVAHEINTPLAFVSSNLQMLQTVVVDIVPALRRQMKLMEWVPQWDRLNADQKQNWYRVALNNNSVLLKLEESQVLSDATALVDESLVGLDRISEIVVSLKDFSRIDRAQVDDVDIHQCIDSTLVIAHNIVKNKAEIVKEYGSIPHLTCSPSQINQVILNLVTNAAQAIEGEGHIWIKTYAREGDVVIEVRDDGAGIPPDVLPRVFEPFFTTKEVGQGTGLGLSISDKIIRSHGGTLSVVSDVGVGTTFTIVLPVAQAASGVDVGLRLPGSRDSTLSVYPEEVAS